MISWHKKGQKVALRDEFPACDWRSLHDGSSCAGPKPDTVYEISGVELWNDEVFFNLKELGALDHFPACAFRPVYPETVASLVRLCGARPSLVDA